jgi:hypothetical protein
LPSGTAFLGILYPVPRGHVVLAYMIEDAVCSGVHEMAAVGSPDPCMNVFSNINFSDLLSCGAPGNKEIHLTTMSSPSLSKCCIASSIWLALLALLPCLPLWT